MSDSLLLPSASETVVAIGRLIIDGEFWSALEQSNEALAGGFALSVLVGVPSGLALARWPAIDRWLDVYVDVLLVVPKSALMPLIVMVLGFGLVSRLLIVFSFAFPVIVVTVRAGAREVEPRLVAMARAFCANEAQIWRHVLLPGALPAVMTALRLGLARSVAGMISVELLLIAVGVGQLIMTFRASFDAASMYATVLLVMLEAVVLLRVAGAFERRFGSWSGTEVVE